MNNYKEGKGNTMKILSDGRIQMTYIDGECRETVTGNELNKYNKNEVLCYFKGGTVNYIDINCLNIEVKGCLKSLNSAIADKDVIISNNCIICNKNGGAN